MTLWMVLTRNMWLATRIVANVSQVGDSNFTDLKNETKWKIK